MMVKKTSKEKCFMLLMIVSSIFGHAQLLSSSVDKKTLALGEVNTLTVKIDNIREQTVSAAPKNELLPFHFEEIKDSTSITNQQYTRTIEFSVYEEGKFTIPVLEFKVGDRVLKTIPYEIDVINTAQRGDEINDILKNREPSLGIKDYFDLYKLYIFIAIAVIALATLLYFFLKYGRKPKEITQGQSVHQTLKQLETLKNKKYIEQGNYRAFYVEIIDITRAFITKQYRLPADVLLTDDLIAIMKINNTISPDNEKVIADVFSRGDLVKFAKIIPDQSLMNEDFNQIKAFVQRSIKDIEFENLRKDV